MGPDYRRLRYIRYSDDFLLGFIGPKFEAEEIKQELRKFLITLRLEMSDEKTLITYAANAQVRFLDTIQSPGVEPWLIRGYYGTRLATAARKLGLVLAGSRAPP